MRKELLTALAGAALALSAWTLPASAQVRAPEPLVVTAMNVTARTAGRTTPEGQALPGDVLEYRLNFTNVRDGAALGVVFSNPVPDQTVYLLGTAGADRGDAQVEFSVDGGESWSNAPTVPVLVNGELVQRPAPAEAYTDIRWTLRDPVAPGARVSASFRVTATAAGEP